MDFMQWTESRYLRPVVMVDATPAADAVCLKNGLDLVQLLRPFASLPGSVLTAHVGERGEATTVRGFAVRLMRPECVREVGADGYRQHTQRVMRGAAAMDLAYGEQLDGAVRELLHSKAGSPLPSPVRMPSPAMATTLLERSRPVWHTQFVRDYHALVRCGYFETVDHPVGVILAASTAEPGGIDGVLRTFKEQAMRTKEMRTGTPEMDGEVHMYYLLVHDLSKSASEGAEAGASPPLQEARKVLAAMQQLYGTGYCGLIKINSAVDPQHGKCLDPEPWVEANQLCLDVPSDAAVGAAHATAAAAAAAASSSPPPSPTAPALRFNHVRGIFGRWPDGTAKVTGCYMSPDDVADVKDIMGYYLSLSLFRFLERRLRVLDIKVQDRRTTTLGKVANWFKSKEEAKPRAEVYYPTSTGPARYVAASLEMMMRRCADLSMFLQNYNGAVEYFKMCLDELLETLPQRPFNWTYIAGCQEGVGTAYLFLGKLTLPSLTPWHTRGTRAGFKLNQVCRLEVSLNDYLTAGAQTYALRMALFLCEFCRTRAPPVMDRARVVLQHILRSGLTSSSKLFSAIISDMLASSVLFDNPPHPAGLAMSPTAGLLQIGGRPAAVMPANYPVSFHMRTYVRFLVEAGARYYEAGSAEAALRCYLRVLGVLRGLGNRGCWADMYELVLLTISRQYFSLGQDIKGLVMASAAVAHGTPMYRNPHGGLESFQRFWERQAFVLSRMGYSLSPHMPMPCIVRSSFHITYNHYHTDDTTEAETRQLGKQAADKEWRQMEDYLRNHYNKTVLSANPSFHFPAHNGELKRNLVFPTSSSSSSSGGVAGGATPLGGAKHYYIAHTEPLWLSFVMHNPVGGAITASNISILYMSRQRPEQLWKSAATKTVTLEPDERREVALALNPLEPGEYVVIGLCWSLLGQEGYYYFATRESRPGCPESLYEYAIENPTPALDAAENVVVTVTAPLAWVTATLDPPPPSRMRDGEYFHTQLVVTNGSKQQAARSVTLQRSPHNAHLMYLDSFGITKNLHGEAALTLTESLGAGESVSFPLTVRAQHDHGDASVRCMNTLLFLIAYLPGDGSVTGGGGLAKPPAPATKRGRGFSGSEVRLHRLLRRVEVVPLMALYSTVLPPSSAELASAVVVTVKHITAEMAPVRVARVMALHRPHWSVTCAYTGSLLEDRSGDCLVPAGSSLTLPLRVQRRLCAGDAGAPADDAEPADDLDSDAEEKGERGGSGSGPVYVDSECLALTAALPAPAKAAAVRANLGGGLAESERDRYFMRTSFCGAGRVGVGADPAGDTLAFYLDKASQAAQTRHARRAAERARERRMYGALLERYTPVVVGVAWAMDSGPGTPLSSGQLFHFVDPVAFLQQPGAGPGSLAVGRDRGSGGESGPSEVIAVAGATATATADHQAQLCACLTKNRSTAAVEHGAVVYHVRVPLQVTTTATLPTAALAPVTLRCLSLSPVPLLVHVRARPPEAALAAGPSPGPLLLFVGKVEHAFYLAPGGTHEVGFTAHLLTPGLVDCNRFHVTATPLLFHPGRKLRTGLGKAEVLRRVGGEVAGTDSGPDGRRRPHLPASPRRGDGRGAHDLGVSPRAAEGEGDEGDDASLAVSAHSGRSGGARLPPGLCGGPTTHTARGPGADGLARLVPRGFQPSRVRVLGAAFAAPTLARLPHLHADAAPAREAAAEAFMERNKAYAGDAVRYELRAEAFREKERARAGASVGRSTTTTTTTTYVYRPRVRLLPPAGPPSTRADSTARVEGGAAELVASTRASSLASAPAPHLTREDLSGEAAVAAGAPVVVPISPDAKQAAGDVSPSGDVAAEVEPGPQQQQQNQAPPAGSPRGRPVELLPLKANTPYEQGPARTALVGGEGSHDDQPAAHGVPGSGADAGLAPLVFSPILSRRRDTRPLGHDDSRTDASRRGAPPSLVASPGAGSSIFGPSTMGSPVHLPRATRTLSQQGVEVGGDSVESPAASPGLPPRDSDRHAFPVVEGDEGHGVGRGAGSCSTTEALDTSMSSTRGASQGRLGVPVPNLDELLPPGPLQRHVPPRRGSLHAGSGAPDSATSPTTSCASLAERAAPLRAHPFPNTPCGPGAVGSAGELSATELSSLTVAGAPGIAHYDANALMPGGVEHHTP